MNLIPEFLSHFPCTPRFPCRVRTRQKEAMRYAMCFFPVIGAVIGGLLSLWICLTGDSTGSLFRASVAVLIPLIVTGGIHLDGLLDAADALSSYKTMEEKLEILKDSHTGAFAIVVGCALVYPVPRCLVRGASGNDACAGCFLCALQSLIRSGCGGFSEGEKYRAGCHLLRDGGKTHGGSYHVRLSSVFWRTGHLAGSGLRCTDGSCGRSRVCYRMSKKKFGRDRRRTWRAFLTVSELVMAFTVIAVFLIRG